MENWENQNFEREWRKAMADAELAPSGDVWQNIDVRLIQSENVSMKRRVLYYQRIAAASIGVMILFSAYAWFSGDRGQEYLSGNGSGVLQEPSSKPNNEADAATKNANDANLSSKQSENSSLASGSAVQSKENNQKEIGGAVKSSIPGNNQADAKYSTLLISQFESNSIGDVSKPGNAHGSIQSIESDRVHRYSQGVVSSPALMEINKLPLTFKPNDYSIAYRVADARPAVIVHKQEQVVNESKWAALGFSAGSFSPGMPSGNIVKEGSPVASWAMDNLKSNQQSTTTQSIKPGTSRAITISGGKRLFKKWILQGGVSYLNQNSTTENNIVSVAPANLLGDSKIVNSYSPETTSSVTYRTQQEINSTFQFVSVPIQVGYMIVDRKIGVQLNGGVSPDFFLKNSQFNESTMVETTSSAGNNSSFSAVSLSGLGGIEFSYRFLSHYRLSLVPGVKYSFTPIYKEVSMASAKPIVADIGLRFRYIF